MVQIRNVPDRLHGGLTARAAAAGKTLSGYLLDELHEYAARPTLRELVEAARAGQAHDRRGGDAAALLVVDARAILDVLLAGPAAATTRRALRGGRSLHVPEHFHIELFAALRRHDLRGEISGCDAEALIERLADLRVVRHPVLPLRDAIWRLRHHRLNTSDAAYLALAQTLDCRLVTRVAGLAAAAREDGRLAEAAA